MALAIRPSDFIKARVIDYLIELFDDVVIGNEVMYGSGRRIVDLLALYNSETYAIEIKSSKDDLRRLPEQVSEYSRIFDHTIIFTTADHLASIRDLVKNTVSVFEVSLDGKIRGRLLKRKNSTLKEEMLATMNSAFIRKRLQLSKYGNSDVVRRKAMKYKKDIIHALLFDYFMGRLFDSFKLFLDERCGRTQVDDIIILSSRINVE